MPGFCAVWSFVLIMTARLSNCQSLGIAILLACLPANPAGAASANERLNPGDPMAPAWKEIVNRLPAYPADDHGFMLGRKQTSSPNHRHFSNLSMICPLHPVNIQQPGTMDVLRRSFDRARSTAGPGQGQAMVQAHAGSIRVFPALPGTRKDTEFHGLSAGGAFLFPAQRRAGKTSWVKSEIRSHAGEPFPVRPTIAGEITLKGHRAHNFRQTSPGTCEIDLQKGEEVLILPSTRAASDASLLP